MKICFFTMSNAETLPWARRLISSGDVVDRPVWFYRIPKNHPDPKRYKLELLAGDMLPRADKYVYLDADCIFQHHGNWESVDWTGAKHESWESSKDYSSAFPNREGWPEFAGIYDRFVETFGEFPRLNSGVIAVPADRRKDLAKAWMDWDATIDELSQYRLKVRDQIGFGFAAHAVGLSTLPTKSVGVPKREVVDESFSLIHASGRPNTRQIVPYKNAVNKILGGYMRDQDPQTDGFRWQVLAKLLLEHAEDPTHPVMAEVGVFKGWNVEHMLKAFPGLVVHGADSREPPGPQKRHLDTDAVWEKLCAKYNGRITFQRLPGTEVAFREPLDLIFDDSDHRTEAVIAHCQRFWPMLKMGGVYVVHDLDYRGIYYAKDSVRKAMGSLFGKYHTGADKTAWVIKRSEEIPGND